MSPLFDISIIVLFSDDDGLRFCLFTIFEFQNHNETGNEKQKKISF